MLPGCSRQRSHPFDPGRDSLTVRAYIKGWGMEQFNADRVDAEWNVDSATIRVMRGGLFEPVRARWGSQAHRYQFEVVDATALDSCWVRPVRGVALADVHAYKPDAPAETTLVTSGVRWWTTTTTDGGFLFGLRMVPARPESRRGVAANQRIIGRILDAATDQPLSRSSAIEGAGRTPAVVHIAWSKERAVADSDGHFLLEHVPSGWVKLNVFALGYEMSSRVIRVPAEPVVIRLLRGWADMLPVPDGPNLASATPIPHPGKRPTTWWTLQPPVPALVGRWVGILHCAGGPLEPGCQDDSVRFEFTHIARAPDLCRLETFSVSHGEPLPLLADTIYQTWDKARWSGTAGPDESSRHWEFWVSGDTLVGQWVHTRSRELVRELRMRRL